MITIFTSISLLLLSSLTFAQTTTENEEPAKPVKWYQVELFIFANNNPDDANQEQWRQDLGLKYPQKIIDLTREATTEVQLPILADSSLLPTEPPATVLDTESAAIIENDNPPLPETGELPPATDAEESTDTPPLLTLSVAEQPFTLLTPEHYQLSEIIESILSKADFRQLLHQAWRQPIGKRNQAESLLIRGGDSFDSHYELEGYINLSVERYLHINTDLWLSTFVSNVGREQEPWPILPKAPLSSVAKTNIPTTDIFAGGDNYSNSYIENPFLDISSNQYSVDRTIALRQHRRMRSNELHYIDHPLMGVLIKITPYEFPDPDEAEEISEDSKPVTATELPQ